MSYRNFATFLGARWIGKEDIKVITDKFPDRMFDVDVYFTDGSQKPLATCTGKEHNIEKIVIAYLDGVGNKDKDPYVEYVYGPVNGADFLNGTFDRNPVLYFYERCKDEFHPQTRNEDPRTIAMVREAARRRFVDFVGMNGVDTGKKDGTLHIPLNIFNKAGRKNLLSILENLDSDGINVFVDVEFDHSTIDQLQRLDTEMELIKVEQKVASEPVEEI